MVKRDAILVTFALNKTVIFKDLAIVFSDRSIHTHAHSLILFLSPIYSSSPFDHVTISIPQVVLPIFIVRSILIFQFCFSYLKNRCISSSFLHFFSLEMLKLSRLNSFNESLARVEQRNSPQIFPTNWEKLMGRRVVPNRKDLVYVITGRSLSRSTVKRVLGWAVNARMDGNYSRLCNATTLRRVT